MAYYYITDTFSTWNVADPSFPDELPEYGERIYLAVVDGPLNQRSTKGLSQVFEGQFMGAEWLKNWYAELHRDPGFGPNATIIWVKIPPKPQLPEEWKVCGPAVCDERHCAGFDDGYCMSDEAETCPNAKVHREFSIIRHAQRTDNGARTKEGAKATPSADTYNLTWRNATVHWVDWTQEKIAFSISDNTYVWPFSQIIYSASDDHQAIKMIMDRLIVARYRMELSISGYTSRAFLEYVSDILEHPYEWGTQI